MPAPTHAEIAAFHPLSRCLVGCRTTPGTPNRFDDWMCWFDAAKPADFLAVPCTTEPGRYHLQNPGRVAGTAILDLGWHPDLWRLGEHHVGTPQAYPALVQASPARLRRDADRDGIAEPGAIVTTESTGINLHRAHADHRSVDVDKWSAGCCVVGDPAHFARLLGLAKVSGMSRFGLLLVARADQ